MRKYSECLKKKNFSGKVDFHFFVGDLRIAKEIVAHGWSMSFDGPITFAREYDEVIQYIPLEQIMCETGRTVCSSCASSW
jgi:Tat protein secretion system quality control protein TatD with DNase activity